MCKKLLFIVNPRAGRNKSRGPLFDAACVFSEAGYLLDIRNTLASGDATQIVEHCGADVDLIVCHGGDGTLNETVNGLMHLPPEQRPFLSYLPGGSTNDFAASLSISPEPAVAAKSAMRMQAHTLDVGNFNDRHFVYVASFGAFTSTSYSVPQDMKNVLGHFAYILGGMSNLDSLHPYHIRLTADGEVFDDADGYLFGAISNSTSIAGMMKLPPEDVSFNDGEFELMLVRVPNTAAQLQALTHALLYQDRSDAQGLIFRHVRHVTAETQEDIPWTLDGEFVPGAPQVDISIDHGALRMFL